MGALLLAYALPRAFGPLAGVMADRIDARRLMIGCDVGQAAVYAALAILLPPLAGVIALVAAGAAFATVFSPAGRASVPSLVGSDRLLEANAWLGSALNLQVAVGPLLGAGLVALVDVRAALALNTLTFAVSALSLSRLPVLRPAKTAEGVVAALRDGFRFVRGHRAARALVVSLFLAVLFLSMDNPALVFLATDTFDAGASGFGLLASAFGIGMLAASVALILRAPGRPPFVLYLAALGTTGLATVLTGLAPALAAAVAFQALAGVGNAVENVATDTLVQHSVPRAFLGRVFGLASAAGILGQGIAAVAGGFLVDALSPRAVFVIAGAGVVTVIGYLGLEFRRGGVPR